MAITALNTAATGLKALSTRIDVIANNLANAETTAFKRQRVNFEDLLYLTKRHPGALNATDDAAPAGIQVGLGVRVSNTQLDLEVGSLEQTNLPLDVAIVGSGFFKVEVAEGFGDGVAFTRNGNFFRNNEGDLVLGIGDGYRLDPPINIPQDVPADTITISENGRVTGLQPGQIEPTEFGQLELVRFVNPQGLRLLGGSLYMETEASGQALTADPG
ncbi:MAG: flagellar hook-basal body complex protein, partial [Planctomycetota bacterium]